MGVGEVILIVMGTLLAVGLAGAAFMSFLEWLASQYKD